MPVTITLRPRDLTADTASGRATIGLLNSDLSAGTFRTASNEYLVVEQTVNLDGPATIQLEPTESISPDSVYFYRVAGRKDQYFRVPDSDANLNDLIAQYEAANQEDARIAV